MTNINRCGMLASIVGLAAGASLAQTDNEAWLLPDNQPRTSGGFSAIGDSVGCPIDVDTITGDRTCLGVEFAWGFYWISGRNIDGGDVQMIYQLDEDFNLVDMYLQETASPLWGGRDGEAIESENALFFGSEGGELVEYRYDPSTERLDLTQTTVIETDAAGTVRALAWDPDREVFYTKSFGGEIEVFDRDGVFVDLFLDPGFSTYGAGYDPVNGTVWFNDYIDLTVDPLVSIPNVRAQEWDPDTGALTGRIFEAISSSPDGTVGFIPGGMDVISDGTTVTAIFMNQADPNDFVQAFAIEGDGVPCDADCRADIDGDGSLTIFDFLGFQNLFDAGDLGADFDGDGVLTIFDFLEFQNEFDAGCP
ncbi:MAG: GC-type dockerin domain-anchored protein [Planctomycetota bacterium]